MSKHTGIIRRIDYVGRIVIPSELRRKYRIAENDPLEFLENEKGIELVKYKTFSTYDNLVRKIVNNFAQIANTPVVLCTMDEVYCGYGVSIVSKTKTTEELYESLRAWNGNSIGKIIADGFDYTVGAYERLEANDEFIGAVIIPKQNEEPSAVAIACLEFCAKTIMEYID